MFQCGKHRQVPSTKEQAPICFGQFPLASYFIRFEVIHLELHPPIWPAPHAIAVLYRQKRQSDRPIKDWQLCTHSPFAVVAKWLEDPNGQKTCNVSAQHIPSIQSVNLRPDAAGFNFFDGSECADVSSHHCWAFSFHHSPLHCVTMTATISSVHTEESEIEGVQSCRHKAFLVEWVCSWCVPSSARNKLGSGSSSRRAHPEWVCLS